MITISSGGNYSLFSIGNSLAKFVSIESTVAIYIWLLEGYPRLGLIISDDLIVSAAIYWLRRGLFEVSSIKSSLLGYTSEFLLWFSGSLRINIRI